MNEMQLTIVGNVGTKPELKTLESGAKVTTFSVAVTPRRFDQREGGWVDGDTSWITVSAWRGLAENVATSIRIGQRVIVTGRFRARKYTVAEQTRINHEIEAYAVGHDLGFGTAVYTKRTAGVNAVEEAPNGAPLHPGPDIYTEHAGEVVNTGTGEVLDRADDEDPYADEPEYETPVLAGV